ncbi:MULTISPECIES: ROK family protein [unclassified Microbacterium]|uniref:ROK family protein n=1 Tax=unclassified Microbacterium TaxID=2609290 RepID=UPI003016E94C
MTEAERVFPARVRSRPGVAGAVPPDPDAGGTGPGVAGPAGTTGATGARKRTSRDIRSESRLDLLHAMLSVETSTRNELARMTGLSAATVGTLVTELLAENLLAEAGLEAGGTGRPTTVLRINGARGHIVGIDVAETYVRAVVFDAALDELGSAEVSLDESFASVEHIAAGVVRAVDAAVETIGIDRRSLLGVGVALPGLVHDGTGMAGVVPSWAWRNVELIQRLRDRMGAPIVLENPLKAIATAELWFGQGRTSENMVIANLGTGVGAGVVIGGRILRGATDSAGEWGHSLLSLDGRMCRCGRRGCVEAYVGAPGILETLREVDPEHPLTARHQREFIEAVAAAARAADPDAAVVETIDRTARYLGSALADIAAILNPEQLMLTGWTAWTLGDLLLPGTMQALMDRAPRGSVAGLELVISTVRGNSVAIGVATLAFERFLGDVGLPTPQIPVAL